MLYLPSGNPVCNQRFHRNHRHYAEGTLFEAGFAYIGQIIDHVNNKDKGSFKLLGELVWEGRPCYQIEMEYQNFGYVDYIAGKDETPRYVAKELNLNEYKIFELNPNIEKYQLIPEGQKIRIPNCYAKRMELSIDKENFLPIYQKIYDDLGLFEIYEFANLRLNPQIDEGDFDLKGSREKK